MKAGWLVVLAMALSGGVAGATTIGFTDLPSGTEVTNQYAGVTFSGGSVVSGSGAGAGKTAGELKNDSGGAVTMTFATPQNSVTGYYTASQQLTVSAYSATGELLGTTQFSPSPGQSAAWTIGGSGIAKVAISANGGEFRLDDLSYSYSAPGADRSVVATQTPEPASLVLLGTGLCAGAVMCIYRAAARRGDGAVVGGGMAA